MIEDIIIKVIEFLAIRFEGEIWSDIKKIIAKYKNKKALEINQKDLENAISSGDEKKIDQAGVDSINGSGTK